MMKKVNIKKVTGFKESIFISVEFAMKRKTCVQFKNQLFRPQSSELIIKVLEPNAHNGMRKKR